MSKSEKEVQEVTPEVQEVTPKVKEETKPKEKMISRTFNTHVIKASKIEADTTGAPIFKEVDNLSIEQEQMNTSKALVELSKVYGAGSYFVSDITTTSKTFEMSVSQFLELAKEVVK
jgi:hypothetical protein